MAFLVPSGNTPPKAVEASAMLNGIRETGRQREEAKIKEQLERGICNISPLPESEEEPFRSILVLEQHPLFVDNSFDGPVWVYEKTVRDRMTGEEATQRVTVGDKKSSRGVLKQKHQEILYKLFRIWAESGSELLVGKGGFKHAGLTMSAYQLVKYIYGNDSKKSYRYVKDALDDLSCIPVSITNAFTKNGLVNIDLFRLLQVEWRVRGFDPSCKRPCSSGVSAVHIIFSSRVTEEFLKRRVKMLFLGRYLSIGAGRGPRPSLARLIYPFLDYQLARKDRYNISFSALLKRFGSSEYEYKSSRRNRVLRAVTALQGLPLSKGDFALCISTRESSSGKDYVLCASKKERKQKKSSKDAERSKDSTEVGGMGDSTPDMSA